MRMYNITKYIILVNTCKQVLKTLCHVYIERLTPKHLMIIISLIIFFIILIGMQLMYPTKEGYEQYDTNTSDNALILAQKNAGNIMSLKEQIDQLSGLQQQVTDISGNVVSLNSQMQVLIDQQGQMATEMSGGGGPPPDITGAVSSDDTTTLANDNTTDLIASPT